MANNLFTPLCRMFDLSVVIAISRNVFDHATSRSKMSNCLPYIVWFAATRLVKGWQGCGKRGLVDTCVCHSRLYY